MAPPALAPRLRFPLAGQNMSTSLNWTSPISVSKLLLYYPGRDGYQQGVRNIVPPTFSGLTGTGDEAGGRLDYSASGNFNLIDYEDDGTPVLRCPTSGSAYLGAATWASLSPGAWTAFCWIRPYSINTSNAYALITHGQSSFISYNVGLDIVATSNVFRAYATIGGGFNFKIASSSTVPVAGRTYFVAGTWDGSNVRVFVNGALEGTTAAVGTADSDGTRWRFGDYATAGNYDGTMWSMGLFGRALEPWEIRYLYTNPYTLVDGWGVMTSTPRGGGGGEWRM